VSISVQGRELFVSVDIETSGPTPGTGSMVAIGACLVHQPEIACYVELKPIEGLPWLSTAEAIHGLSRSHLAERALLPAEAMAAFRRWLEDVAAGAAARPVFVGFNAPFDWMFVADYLERFTGGNPFGHSALDLKALFMGRDAISSWSDTSKGQILARYPVELPHTHHALDDARMQAALARALLVPSPPEPTAPVDG
jgi:DNA polymerase III alpha subunit (gram-positive type)